MTKIPDDSTSTEPVTPVRNRNEPPLLLRGEQAAHLLSMGRSKVFAMMASGQLPGVIRIGRSIRISREALERWVREQTDPAIQDPSQSA